MKLLDLLFPAKVIAGCRDPKPLMTRRRILSTPWFAIKLHHFHRSDEDREVHDHPWPFISLILCGGYDEVTPPPSTQKWLLQWEVANEVQTMADPRYIVRRRYRPGSLLFRPARWAHRVELLDLVHGSWSLVIVFPKVREWGFHTLRGWLPWRVFHGQAGCGDDTIPTYQKSSSAIQL
jgi:hypothetical protein